MPATSAPRIACLTVPLFPLAARLRSEPELVREAVVVVEGNGNAARVMAATRLARDAGVRPGATLPQARALCPKLVARARDEECERAAEDALLEAAEAFSPRIEDCGGGVAFLDVDGIGRHFPGPSPELDLGRALVAAAAAVGLPARAGIASSKLAARIAAGLPETPVIVPGGEEAAFLAPLPLARLAPEVEIAATLERWGIRSIGDFARLPKSRVASRLGANGRELHSTARGIDPHPLIAREPPPSFEEGMNLEWPLVSLEPFLFVGRSALERLCQRLGARGLACIRLELALQLEPDGRAERAIDLPAPSRDPRTLLTLIRLDLEARPPGAPVAGFTFRAHPDRPREAQLSLYGPAALSPDKLATTLARLFALLGPGRVGSPRLVDGHLPERFALAEYAPPPPPPVRREPRTGRGLLAVRVLRPPLGLEVIVEETAAGREAAPIELRAAVHDVNGEEAKRPKVQGRVKVAAGPWGLEEEWWTEAPTGRDYWDVELAAGGIYRIFRDRATGEWYADGIYD
ncbi:MAG TPA: DNA polymerase Y family protein [Thermoanaerobaculia bacterium]|nr:DNA polymerase Y family protein [Thermoanaerobaculia bacterium]